MKKFTLILSLLALSFSLTISAQTNLSYSYTGTLQTWVVPAGVTQVTITAAGGQGGSGGNGAVVSNAVVAVVPGNTI
ncbi:MAG TPA: hypothetical protein VNY36_04075, partial [Bacteroidia bacterium]|nr:hypothetical protein [Bacteroidia bacterium]